MLAKKDCWFKIIAFLLPFLLLLLLEAALTHIAAPLLQNHKKRAKNSYF